MHEARDIEIVYTKILYVILGVRRSTNLCDIYGKIGRVQLIISRKLNMIKCWIKLLNSSEALITKKVYFMLRNDANRNISFNGANWAFQIKTLLDSLGLSYLWLEVIKLFSYSTQLSTKLILFINVKIPIIVSIFTFISMINTTSERLKAKAVRIYICDNIKISGSNVRPQKHS